jgi:hypothetical protein
MRRWHPQTWAVCLLASWSVACSSGEDSSAEPVGPSAGNGDEADSDSGAPSSGGPDRVPRPRDDSSGGESAGGEGSSGPGGPSSNGGGGESSDGEGGENSDGEGGENVGGSTSGENIGGSSGDNGSAAGAGPSGGSTTGGGANGGSGGTSAGDPTIYPPGSPGCGLEQAAFCETFDAPSDGSTRAGELDGARFSAARMCNIGGPSSDGEAVAIGPARVPACRSGLPEQVFPPDDALICDGTEQIQSNHLLVLVAAQNYGQNSYRIRQPFDFAGRTGKVVFDAEGYNVGLLGWISLEVTEEPIPAPSFTLQENFENGSVPRNGVEIQFSHNCGGDKVGIGALLVYDDFAQTLLIENDGNCVDAAAGKLNHFEVELTAERIDVYATNASDDGLTFGERVLLAGADVALPFSRGYVHFTTHNHATLKYSDETVDAWPARWDNVGFDGPAVTDAFREYEAPDSLDTAPNGKVNVAYRLADEAEGPAQQIATDGVDLEGATSAQLALQNWALHFAGDTPPVDYALNYRVNGNAWAARRLTESELRMMADLPNAGTRSLVLDVDLADLVPGTNTFEFTTSNVSTGYPPVVLNIDLILQTR